MRIEARRAEVQAFLRENRPRIRRRANITIVLTSLSAAFTAALSSSQLRLTVANDHPSASAPRRMACCGPFSSEHLSVTDSSRHTASFSGVAQNRTTRPPAWAFPTISCSRVRSAANERIDGEFNGIGVPSGDGVAGGDVALISSRDKGPTPRARSRPARRPARAASSP